MTKLIDGIESFLEKTNFNDDEKTILRNVLIKLSNFENSIFTNKTTNNIQCIAYKTNKILCDGDKNSKTIRSHIVPENQFKKLKCDYQDFLGFSVRIVDVLQNKFVDGILDSGRFTGFCEVCEKTFKEEIDANITQNNYQLALSTFRYLGKIIYFTEKKIDYFQNILKENDNSIEKNDLNFFINTFTQLSLNEYINKQKKLLFNYTIYFYELRNYWNNNNYKNLYGKDNLYYSKVVTTTDFIISAQSFGLIPIYFKDTDGNLMIFTQFQYDKINKCTICTLFSYKYHWLKIEDSLKGFFVKKSEWAKIFLILSLKHNENFYFIRSSEKIIIESQKIIEILIKEKNHDIYFELKRIIALIRTIK